VVMKHFRIRVGSHILISDDPVYREAAVLARESTI